LIPSALKNTEKIYPWTLLENAQTKPNTDEKNEPKNQDVPFKSKYGSLPMCYKDLTEAHATWNDQKPMKQSETKVFTLRTWRLDLDLGVHSITFPNSIVICFRI
jgi:hypothetical protein